MPVLFRYNGIEYRLWTNDHVPPHIHVRPAQARPEWEVIVYLGNEANGDMDEFGKSFGDTEIVRGPIKTSTINDLVAYLRPRRSNAWAKWKEIHS